MMYFFRHKECTSEVKRELFFQNVIGNDVLSVKFFITHFDISNNL